MSKDGEAPEGFSDEDLPLFKVSYSLSDGSTFTGISSYLKYRERFAKEFCEYLISRTTFIKGTKTYYK